jgi:hypothetical protein
MSAISRRDIPEVRRYGVEDEPCDIVESQTPVMCLACLRRQITPSPYLSLPLAPLLQGSPMILRPPLLLFAVLALTACHNNADQNQVEAKPVRDSLALLNTLEDRTFSLVQLDSTDGSMRLVGTLQELNALAQEARQAVMPGCVGQARNALISVMEEIAQGGQEAWPKVERYVNQTTVCEALLAEQGKRWAAVPG